MAGRPTTRPSNVKLGPACHRAHVVAAPSTGPPTHETHMCKAIEAARWSPSRVPLQLGGLANQRADGGRERAADVNAHLCEFPAQRGHYGHAKHLPLRWMPRLPLHGRRRAANGGTESTRRERDAEEAVCMVHCSRRTGELRRQQRRQLGDLALFLYPAAASMNTRAFMLMLRSSMSVCMPRASLTTRAGAYNAASALDFPMRHCVRDSECNGLRP